MSQRTGQWIELNEQFGDRTDEAGYLTLVLAQAITTFAFWIGIWPAAFGVHRTPTLAVLLAVLSGIAGALGFYLAFRAFDMEPDLED